MHRLIPYVLMYVFVCCPDATRSAAAQHAPQHDPLPSWNSGQTKTAILDFVRQVTTKGTPDFVRPEERITVFDNDGTLWAEQPAERCAGRAAHFDRLIFRRFIQ